MNNRIYIHAVVPLRSVDRNVSKHMTTVIFEAFDEPWEGDPGNPNGAEKHRGLFTIDGQPKAVMKSLRLSEAER